MLQFMHMYICILQQYLSSVSFERSLVQWCQQCLTQDHVPKCMSE